MVLAEEVSAEAVPEAGSMAADPEASVAGGVFRGPVAEEVEHLEAGVGRRLAPPRWQHRGCMGNHTRPRWSAAAYTETIPGW